LTIIDLIKIPDSPFYAELLRTAGVLLVKEDVSRAYVREGGEQQMLRDIWTALGNEENMDALLAVIGVAKWQIFLRAGLLTIDIPEDTVTQ
jgi:hypothetical protein